LSFSRSVHFWLTALRQMNSGSAHYPAALPHGLRKAGENGATDSQLKAMFGWRSAKMAVHYMRKAEQKKLAGVAMGLIAGARD